MKKVLMWAGWPLLITIVTLLGALQIPVEPSQAQGQSVDAVYDAYDFDNVTVGSTAVGLTASKVLPSGEIAARQATCVVETNSIRIRYDGTNPTASVGLLYTSGQSFAIYGANNIRRLRAIRVTSDGALQCQLAR